MKLTEAQLDQFNEQGWIFLPDCFSRKKSRSSIEEGRTSTPRSGTKSGAKHQAHHAPRSQLTPTTRRSKSLAAIPD